MVRPSVNPGDIEREESMRTLRTPVPNDGTVDDENAPERHVGYVWRDSAGA